jgi:hypothetical protein
MKYNKDYLKGFKHGVRWAKMWLFPTIELEKKNDAEIDKMVDDFEKGLKEAIKNLKKC